MSDEAENSAFNYQLLRFTMGIIALMIPGCVTQLGGSELSSISASYYTPGRDYFVGLLCIVAAFLFAYRGESKWQAILSKFAALAAFCTAMFPTSPNGAPTDTTAIIHGLSAGLLFTILTIFCLYFFLNSVTQDALEASKVDTKNKTYLANMRRRFVYFFCGGTMASCIVVGCITAGYLYMGILYNWFVDEIFLIYYIEIFALWAFGFAWVVSGKNFEWLSDSKERMYLVDPRYSFLYKRFFDDIER